MSIPFISTKKIGVLDWLLIAYLLIGFVWAIGCLHYDGDKYSAFAIYVRFANPTAYLIFAIGIGDLLFVEWPTSIYWTAVLIIVNGVALYAATKMVYLLWRRSRKTHPGA